MSDSSIQLRLAEMADLDSLTHLARNTFHDAFAAKNKPEDIEAYMSSAFNKEKIRYDMNHPDCQFWLAIQREKIVGYLKVNFGGAQSDLPDNAALEVERIYVLEKYQGHKIGFQLMKKAFDIAYEADLKYIWLGVWEENEKAIHFYSKLGFKKIGAHTFMMGSDPQKDVLMRISIDAIESNGFNGSKTRPDHSK